MKLRYGLSAFICMLSAACAPALAQKNLPPAGAGLGPVTAEQVTAPQSPATATVFAPTATWTAISTYTPTPMPTATPAPLRFAVIGDYGEGGQNEADVASLVKSWYPEFILTVGDNNYPSGAPETIDAHVGQYYHDFIFPYLGSYGPGAARNRFFPIIGNHDWDADDGQTYLGYFTLPGNERYYDFPWGPVHFFALNADSREPDGVSMNSVQAHWLQKSLSTSTAPWQVVYFHQPPYSSGQHGSVEWMRWPFAQWGADAVLSGHDHIYERLSIDGIPYFVNGIGGGAIYGLGNILPESQVRFNDNYGAMLVIATPRQVQFQFFTIAGELVDSFMLQK